MEEDTRFLDRPENAERRRRAISATNDYLASGGGPVIWEMVDSVLSDVDDIDLDDAYPEDRATEIADSAVPIYTHEIMEAATESIDIATGEPECGPAFDGSPTPSNIIAGNLYDLASNIAHNRLAERQREAEEATEEV